MPRLKSKPNKNPSRRPMTVSMDCFKPLLAANKKALKIIARMS
ncbi:hypothetical protein [Rummeliibacillus sp. TYF-LIM-RU47]|nr:hypothetical protein [Rummeliibacillus sp. TYF-LIM-RU47]